MRTAFIIFDRMTALDFVGVYDPLGRLRVMGLMRDFEWAVCGLTAVVGDDCGLRFLADRVGESLAPFDLLAVPGGYGTRALRHDRAFVEWLRTAEGVPLKASVCSGALLLGAAGFLAGKPATTHPNVMQELAPYCGEVRPDRVVDAGAVVTAGGVTPPSTSACTWSADSPVWTRTNGWRGRWITRTRSLTPSPALQLPSRSRAFSTARGPS